MAMNKKEQAEFASMKKKLAVASAFVRTPAVERDVPAPSPSGPTRYSHGFDFNVYGFAINEYWSSCSSHYTENPQGKSGYVSGSQRGISLYSTRLLALRALRHAVENKAASDLAEIDMKIEAEIKAQEGTK